MVRKAGTGRKGGRKGSSKGSLASSPSTKSQETIKDVLKNVSDQSPSHATPEISPTETQPIKAVPLRQTPSKEIVQQEEPASPSKTKSLTPFPEKSKSKKAPKERSIQKLSQMTETVSSNPKSPSEGESKKKVAKKLDKQLEEVAEEELEEEKETKKMEEDLEVVVTKVVAGTSTGTMKKRQTRAATKVVKVSEEKEEKEATPSEPKRGEKRKGTPSVSRISKAAKGKHTVTPSTGATTLSSRTVLSGCGVEHEYFEIPAMKEVKELLEFQGWMSLFDDLNDAFVGPVREFYVNLKQNIDMSMVSTVSGVSVNVSESVLCELLGIPRDGFGRYSSDGWPLMGGVTAEEVTQFLFGSKKEAVSPSDFREAVMLVLHSMCLKVFLPKGQGRGSIRIMDMVLIYLIMNKVKVNLPVLIMEHMLYCYASSHNSLPYGSFICKIIKDRNPKFSFSGEVVSLQMFTKKILNQKRIDFSGKRLTFVGQESSLTEKQVQGNQKDITSEDVAKLLAKLEKQEVEMKKLVASLVKAEEERRKDKLRYNRDIFTICRVIDYLLPPESEIQFDPANCKIIEKDDEESSSEKGPDAGEDNISGDEEEETEEEEEEKEEKEEEEKKEEEKKDEEGSDFEEEINQEEEEEDEDDDE